jgi:hypothetical protein
LNGKKNEIQINGKGIENLLVNMVLNYFFKYGFEKHLSIILYVGMG